MKSKVNVFDCFCLDISAFRIQKNNRMHSVENENLTGIDHEQRNIMPKGNDLVADRYRLWFIHCHFYTAIHARTWTAFSDSLLLLRCFASNVNRYFGKKNIRRTLYWCLRSNKRNSDEIDTRSIKLKQQHFMQAVLLRWIQTFVNSDETTQICSS